MRYEYIGLIFLGIFLYGIYRVLFKELVVTVIKTNDIVEEAEKDLNK